MRNRGFTLIELLLMLAVAAILVVCAVRISKAEDLDPRQPAFTTGVTVGPWHGGNSWPHTGTGTPIVLRHRDRALIGTPGASDFMDWRALQAHRAHAAAATLLETVTFAFDSAEVSEASAPTLAEAAAVLSENPEVGLFLAGHTDLVGSEEHNEALALRRAEAIKAALIELGVEESRLQTASFGETSPVDLVPGLSEANRRVEVVPTIDLP